MRKGFIRIKGMAYVLWHGKHMLFHVLFGLMWAWFLRELWAEFNARWIAIAVFGSLLPDADHLLYFFTYGKKDPYTRAVVTFLKNKEWRVLATFIEHGHKYNTNLSFHNYYTAAILVGVGALSYVYDWRAGVILFGAMVTHYTFDIVEDILILGRLNPNWKRWGRA